MKPRIFYIDLIYENRAYHLHVILFRETLTYTQYEVKGGNGSFTIQSNEPVWQKLDNRKSVAISWKFIEGPAINPEFFKKVYQAIELEVIQYR